MKTKIVRKEFKGRPLLSIVQTQDNGKPLDAFPIMSFGIKKAEYIVKHLDEIKAFIEDNKNE